MRDKGENMHWAPDAHLLIGVRNWFMWRPHGRDVPQPDG
jgi:hypothetical protein